MNLLVVQVLRLEYILNNHDNCPVLASWIKAWVELLTHRQMIQQNIEVVEFGDVYLVSTWSRRAGH